MAEKDLFYAEGGDGAWASVSIFAERPHVRAMMRDDAEALGFQVGQADTLTSLLAELGSRLGPIVLVDVPENEPAQLASLAELDMMVACQNGHLIVSTSVGALAHVLFGSFRAALIRCRVGEVGKQGYGSDGQDCYESLQAGDDQAGKQDETEQAHGGFPFYDFGEC